MDPVSTRLLVKVAVKFRKPLGKLLALLVITPFVIAGCAVAFVGAAASVMIGSQEACDSGSAARAASGNVEVRSAASTAHLGAAAVAAIAATATAAQRRIPVPTFEAAGPLRLPASMAAGTAGGSGRWNGPKDPSVEADSRALAPLAVRALLRRLRRSTTEWAQLRTQAIPASTADATALAEKYATVIATVLPNAGLTGADVTTEFASPDTSAATGDEPSGGVLLIGDPVRVNLVAGYFGQRAFGGHVTSHPTASEAASVDSGADSDLAAARGVVIAIVNQAPTAADIENLDQATSATVLWFTTAGPADQAHGIYATPTDQALASTLKTITAGSNNSLNGIALCQESGFGLDNPVDPATIHAPDPAAQTAVAYALAHVGEPYVSDPPGAIPPGSWDCSKLTASAWAAAGVRLTPLSYAQAKQVQVIDRSQVAVGDLAFWFGGDTHHVALVSAVNGSDITIVEAANPSAGVRVRHLGGSWDASNLSGFGRVHR